MLSKEEIFESLPRVVFKDRRHIPKSQQGVYFLITKNDLIYIGASKCIYSRLTSTFTTDHPVGKYLGKMVEKHLSFGHGNRWSNYQEKVLYNNAFDAYWRDFKINTVVAWLPLSGTRADLFKLEGILIEQYQPKINCKHTVWAKQMTWGDIEKLAQKKGYDLEWVWLAGSKWYRIRRLNWKSQLYQKPEGLKLYLDNRAIDWGGGYIP